MIDSIDSSSRQFLLANESLTRRLQRAQQQVSSGKRIETASDAPDQIGELLQVRSSIAQNQQIQSNLAGYKLEEDVAANALDQASGVIDSVRETIEIGEKGGLPTQVTHHKVIGKSNWGKSVATLKLPRKFQVRR